MEAFNASDEMTRGKAVVEALYAAGFRHEELAEMAAIAYHESGWHWNVWVGPPQDNDDIGGGLFGINQKPYIDAGQVPPWSKEEIQDPYRSAEIAYTDFYKTRGYKPWTTRDKPRTKGDQARAAC